MLWARKPLLQIFPLTFKISRRIFPLSHVAGQLAAPIAIRSHWSAICSSPLRYARLFLHLIPIRHWKASSIFCTYVAVPLLRAAKLLKLLKVPFYCAISAHHPLSIVSRPIAACVPLHACQSVNISSSWTLPGVQIVRLPWPILPPERLLVK